jgi:hypothetical protein
MLLQSENLGAMNGTEKDGRASDKWCKLCYVDGSFTGPDCTLVEMQQIVNVALKKERASFIYRLFVKQSISRLERWAK